MLLLLLLLARPARLYTILTSLSHFFLSTWVINFVVYRNNNVFAGVQETSLLQAFNEIHKGDVFSNKHVNLNILVKSLINTAAAAVAAARMHWFCQSCGSCSTHVGFLLRVLR